MPDTSLKPRAALFEITEWRPVSKNTLCGFATVKQPSGMIVADISVHVRDGKSWASPPFKPILDRDGRQMVDASGKSRWSPVVTFIDRSTQAAWSDAVIAALRSAHPKALS